MDSNRWQRIEEIYHEALQRPTEERATLLESVCGHDRDLRYEVASLLAHADLAETFLESHSRDAKNNLPSGQQIGGYEIQSLLGAGGMGEVYRAHDQNLCRDVALKVLPPEFARDPERLVRFRREARTLAALNHPNIAAIYGLEESDGLVCLVLELVEGETLHGPLPILKALDYASQVADALGAAHEKGIIHRDLKPVNVKVTCEGRVKVLDFGLAKAVWASEEKQDLLPARSLTELGTLAGPIVGSPGYMSPEQSHGKEVDQRTDVWAFGCLLYELLSGKRAFEGKTFEETVEDLRNREPDWTALPAKTPTKIRELLRRCLLKDVAHRLPAIIDARKTIEQALHRRTYWAFAAIAIVVVAAGAVVGLVEKRREKVSDPSKWVQLTYFQDSVSQPALSPDGRMLAFVRGPGTFYTPGQVYLKELPDGEAKQLTDDEFQKMRPTFSPDGSRIAYTTVDRDFHWNTWLTSISAEKPVQWLENASGLVWAGQQRLLFSELRTGIHMALVASEESRTNVRNDIYVPASKFGMAHLSYPSPDGRWALIAEMNGRWLPCRLVLLDGSSAGRAVGPADGACTAAGWSPDGKWMYFSASVNGAFHLWRQRFEGGSPEQITTGPTEQEGVAVAADGRSLITAIGLRQRPLVLHMAGRDRQLSLEGYAINPTLTADGRFLLYRILNGSQTCSDPSQLWVTRLGSGHSERMLPGVPMYGSGNYDVAPDGNRVVISAPDSNGKSRLWMATLDGRLPPRQLPGIEGDSPVFGNDGEILFHAKDNFAYRVRDDGTGLAKALEKPILAIRSISADKKWLVVADSNISIYPLSGGESIHLPGDFMLNWSPDGRLLYFSWPQEGLSTGAGVTYVIPLRKGEMIPQVFRDGIRSKQDLANLPGVKVIEAADVAPGPEPQVYAYSREVTQRNLFRIPIP